MSLGLKAGASGLYDRAVLNTAFAVFVLSLLYVGFRHEAWFDEAQAWLIARDDTPWRILSQTARYEGTPPLWHLLLWAPAHLGYPYRGLWLISATLACGGAYIVLYRSVFPALMRVGIVFSYYFAYQYAIIARSYAIDLVLFPAIALLHRQRLDRPILYCILLGLIANCNTFGVLFSGILLLDVLWAGTKQRPLRSPQVVGALIYGLMALTAVASAWPPSDVSFQTNQFGGAAVLHAIMLITEPFVERLDIFSLQEPVVASYLGGLVLSILLVWPTAYLFHSARRLWLFAAIVGVFFAFTAVKYGQPWHAGLLFLAWIFCLWTSWEALVKLSAQRRFWLRVSIIVILFVQCWYTVAAWTREVRQPYAPGRDVMSAIDTYLRTHPRAKVAGMGFNAFAIQPWSDRNVFDNYRNHTAHAAYFEWRTSQPYVGVLNLASWRKLVGDHGYQIIILSSLETLTKPGDLTAYYAAAARYGYCGAYFPAGLIWKTYTRGNESIVMFTPCRLGGGANTARPPAPLRDF